MPALRKLHPPGKTTSGGKQIEYIELEKTRAMLGNQVAGLDVPSFIPVFSALLKTAQFMIEQTRIRSVLP